jgi:hypothetical protein
MLQNSLEVRGREVGTALYMQISNKSLLLRFHHRLNSALSLNYCFSS